MSHLSFVNHRTCNISSSSLSCVETSPQRAASLVGPRNETLGAIPVDSLVAWGVCARGIVELLPSILVTINDLTKKRTRSGSSVPPGTDCVAPFGQQPGLFAGYPRV